MTLTFDSNWKKAKTLFLETLQNGTTTYSKEDCEAFEKGHQDFYFSIEEPRPAVFISLDEKGVVLTLRYVTEPRKRRKVHHALMEKVLCLIAKEEDLCFAFPTQSLIFPKENPVEKYKGQSGPLHSKNLN